MAVLTWDEVGKRLYETGTDRGVVYPYSSEGPNVTLTKDTHGIESTTSKYGPGAAWNGLTSVAETPSGAEPTDLYADNIKYLSIRSAETHGGTIEAYTYPPEFAILDGSKSPLPGMTVHQQARGSFGMSYRTVVGNDTDLDAHGYKLHLVYGCTVSPSERTYNSINDSPEPVTFSWEYTTTPVAFTKIEGYNAASLITIDSTLLGEKAGNLKKLEACLYGTADQPAFLPTPDEVYDILNSSEAV